MASWTKSLKKTVKATAKNYATNYATKSLTKLSNSLLGSNSLVQGVLDTIEVTAESGGSRAFGYSLQNAKTKWETIYNAGTINKASYVVKLSHLDGTPVFLESVEDSGLLATEVDFPLAPLNFEQKRLGGSFVNVFQDLNYQSFTVTFLETLNLDVISMLKNYRDDVLHDDGTSQEPYHYALRLSLGLFGVNGSKKSAYDVGEFVVAMSAENIQGLGAKNYSEVLEIPVTFHVLDPYVS